jgi:hypothetical protein
MNKDGIAEVTDFRLAKKMVGFSTTFTVTI